MQLNAHTGNFIYIYASSSAIRMSGHGTLFSYLVLFITPLNLCMSCLYSEILNFCYIYATVSSVQFVH